MSFGKKFLICPILPPMSDLTPFYGTEFKPWRHQPAPSHLVTSRQPRSIASDVSTQPLLLRSLHSFRHTLAKSSPSSFFPPPHTAPSFPSSTQALQCTTLSVGGSMSQMQHKPQPGL